MLCNIVSPVHIRKLKCCIKVSSAAAVCPEKTPKISHQMSLATYVSREFDQVKVPKRTFDPLITSYNICVVGY